MSAASQEKIDRWNMYKSRVDSAGSAVIRATQFLVRSSEDFPKTSNATIKSAWNFWRDEEECFYRMTKPDDELPMRRFPVEPEVGAEDCCFRMWGLLIQVQIDGTHGSTDYLRKIVEEIAANEKCQSHPATCACHVPEHPWVYRDDVEAMKPIRAQHNPKCQCAGYQRCDQRDMVAAARAASIKATQVEEAFRVQAVIAAQPEAKAAAAPAQKASSPYDYKHNVESCACGTCHKARLDSGTADEYLSNIQARSHAVFWGLEQAAKPVKGIGAASYAADVAIAKASAACGGGANHPGFAQALFTAMGTPHDSKCPHGMPFYACMPCSH